MTLRKLVWMAEAKVRHDWSQTSSLMALIANAHRPRNVKPFKPSDFAPHLPNGRSEANDRVMIPREELPGVLKQVFLRKESRS